jgi:hypothetical protein
MKKENRKENIKRYVCSNSFKTFTPLQTQGFQPIILSKFFHKSVTGEQILSRRHSLMNKGPHPQLGVITKL